VVNDENSVLPCNGYWPSYPKTVKSDSGQGLAADHYDQTVVWVEPDVHLVRWQKQFIAMFEFTPMQTLGSTARFPQRCQISLHGRNRDSARG